MLLEQRFSEAIEEKSTASQKRWVDVCVGERWPGEELVSPLGDKDGDLPDPEWDSPTTRLPELPLATGLLRQKVDTTRLRHMPLLYRTVVRPSYKVAYRTVTALEWKCCPGYRGVHCEEGMAKINKDQPPHLRLKASVVSTQLVQTLGRKSMVQGGPPPVPVCESSARMRAISSLKAKQYTSIHERRSHPAEASKNNFTSHDMGPNEGCSSGSD
ncbi:hypothetical protein Z043_116450 [Scleropages formosus]|uniref:EMI domain-containing protein n=1 Tax=Scleropages formosus TaxID=113540 RepID=A0A0P7UBW3_SCLFO|nr:hypothetical protein Z043_116450 [Scleropages formosus]